MDPCPSPVPDPTDPADMTEGDRLAEVASILAEGVLRLKSRSVLGLGTESAQDGLEECDDQSVHAPVG